MVKQAKNPKTTPGKESSIAKKTKINLWEIPHLEWWLAGIYFAVMAIITFSYHKIGDYGIETDFFWSYVPQAQKFLEGSIEIDKYRGPLYPIVLGVFKLFTGNYFAAGLLIAILSASFVLFFSYRLLKSLFNPLIALAAVVVVAVNTTFNLYTYSAGTDMFFNFLITAALFFLLGKKEYRLKNLLIAGIFSALAYLTRYNGIFIVVSAAVIVLFINVYRIAWVKRLIAVAAFAVVFIVLIAPWGIYTKQERGKAFFNQNYQNIAYEYLAKDKMSWDEFWFQGNRDKYTSLTQVILLEPGAFFSKMVSNGTDHLKKDLGSLAGWHVGIFSVIGLLLLVFRKPDRQQWGWLLANVLFFGVLLLVFYSERFSLFLIPMYVALALNVFFLENKVINRKIIEAKAYFYLIAAFFVLITISKSYAYNSENINSGDKNLEKIAKDFQKLIPENERGDRILARKAHIAYYLGLQKEEMTGFKTYPELVTKLWKSGTDYVYYGIWEMGRGLDFLQDVNKLPPDFELVTYSTSKNKSIMPVEQEKTPYKIEVKKQEQPALLFRVKMDSNRLAIIEAGKWLEQNEKGRKLNIMALTPYLTAYTGQTLKDLVPGNIDMLIQKARYDTADYIYFGLFEAASSVQLTNLLNAKDVPADLEPVLKIFQSGNFPAVLYRVKK